MRHLGIVLALSAIAASIVALGACAQGTSDGISGHPDAHVSTLPDTNFNSPADAPVFSTPDARVNSPADAFVQPTPDATSGGGTGGVGSVCNGDGDCDSSQGLCCFDLGQPPGFCVAGTEAIPGVCIPN